MGDVSPQKLIAGISEAGVHPIYTTCELPYPSVRSNEEETDDSPCTKQLILVTLMLQEDNWENKLKQLERLVRVQFFKTAALLNIPNINKDVGKLFR